MTDRDSGEVHQTSGASQRKGTSLRGIVVIFLGMIPLGAVAGFYTLFLTPATVSEPDALRRVSFGWPFPWLTQDLSRYQPVEFPTTVDYTSTRAWDDPIATEYDWLLFTADAILFGALLTGLLLAVTAAIRSFRSRRLG